MPLLVSKDAVDTASTNLCCIFPGTALEGEVISAQGVYFEGKPVLYYRNGTKCSDVSCQRTPIPDPPCSAPLTNPIQRVIATSINKSVYINGNLFAVQGDTVASAGTTRNIVGPFTAPTIRIQNSVN